MSSTFTWLDHSERDRRKTLDVIDRFRESEARDELGFGVVSGTFSEMLFPGTGTLQTRARYFLFVPWIYRYLEGRRVGSNAGYGGASDLYPSRLRRQRASDRRKIPCEPPTNAEQHLLAGFENLDYLSVSRLARSVLPLP